MPSPKVHVGLGIKFVPLRVTFSDVTPCIPLFGLRLVNAGGGFRTRVTTLNPLARFANCPSGLVTVTFLPPSAALYNTVIFAVNCELETNVHEDTVIPAPNEHVAPFRKFAPARFTVRFTCPCEPELGVAVVSVGGRLVVTVMVRTGGLGSVLPAESVTVSEAVYTPLLANVTGPGLAKVLVLGLPPRIDHEYPVIEPLVALPVPAKFTDCPGVKNIFEVGLVIVPVGGVSFGVKESCTNFAIEGTPVLLIRKSM